ncbi:MAG: hypothetical protein AAGI11_18335 [Pseudomonadota bacterium]
MSRTASHKLMTVSGLMAAVLLVGGCAQSGGQQSAAPEQGDSAYLKAKNTRADAVYIAEEPGENASGFRALYIAPAVIDGVQIIQPEGVESDAEWEISDLESEVLRKAISDEFSTTLTYESAYNLVDSEEDADMVLHTTVVALHPYATKAEVDAGARKGGAVTISLALVNEGTGKVMVRSIDTKSTDDIYAFHQVEADPAFNLIFRSWGNSLRRGLLFLQGRTSDPLATELLLKEQ